MNALTERPENDEQLEQKSEINQVDSEVFWRLVTG